MVKEDGTLELTCSVDSYPPSDITWSKNGTSPSLQNYTEKANLTISNVTREHAGEYVCTVHHHNRTMTASTVVTVLCKYKLISYFMIWKYVAMFIGSIYH